MAAKAYKTRLHKTAARYRDARKSLHTPASPRSRYGLDWILVSETKPAAYSD